MFYKVSVYQCLLHVVCGIYVLWLGLLAKLFGNGTLVVGVRCKVERVLCDSRLVFTACNSLSSRISIQGSR
jgi:hypothetical protein